MEPSPTRPHIPLLMWLDWTYVAALLGIRVMIEVVSYYCGYHDDPWMFMIVGMVALPLAIGLWVTLVIRPVLCSPRDFRSTQLMLRLFLFFALPSACYYGGNLLHKPGSVPPAVLNKKRDFTTKLNAQDYDALRADAQKRLKAARDVGESVFGSWTVSADELPGNLKHIRRGETAYFVTPHKRDQGVEVQFSWGGALSGYHGLIIDPEEAPKEGLAESPDGLVEWHFKLADGIYFFARNG